MELSQMTALELSRNIRGKKICVSDSVESVFHQIRKKEKKIHAYLDLYEEDAYKRAEQVQKGIEQGIYTGPLAGVPIAVKDNICIRGKKTTCASGILENFIPTYQAEVIDRLEQAGMILIGKRIWTNLPWEVQQKHLLLVLRQIRGIQSMYRAVHQGVPVRQLRPERHIWLLDPTQAVPFVSPALFAE